MCIIMTTKCEAVVKSLDLTTSPNEFSLSDESQGCTKHCYWEKNVTSSEKILRDSLACTMYDESNILINRFKRT